MSMSPDNRTDKAVPPCVERMVQRKDIADTYDETFARNPLLQYDLALLTEWFDKPGRLLDLGCGTGRTMLAFGQRGCDVTGVDLSPPMLARAREKLDAAGLTKARLFEGNISDLPMDKLDPPYDYACCLFATLGYVQGPENRVRALSQARSLLAPGGQCVFHVQNLFYNMHTLHLPWILTGVARWAVGRGDVGDQVFWWCGDQKWLTMHAFRPREVERLISDAGLELMEFHYLDKEQCGPVKGERWRAWRSNGFFARCRRPREES
jgi:SAM-dependent methyltransferase